MTAVVVAAVGAWRHERGDKGQQIRVIAADEGEGLGLILRDLKPAFTGFGFQLQGDVADLDRGCIGIADFEQKIDVLAAGHIDGDGLGLGRREAWRNGFDVVDAHAQ